MTRSSRVHPIHNGSPSNHPGGQNKSNKKTPVSLAKHWSLLGGLICAGVLAAHSVSARERLSLDADWKFTKDDPTNFTGSLKYSDIKDWVNATGAEFTKETTPAAKPAGNPGGAEVPYAQSGFDDSHWRSLNLPHDWGIEGPFKQ